MGNMNAAQLLSTVSYSLYICIDFCIEVSTVDIVMRNIPELVTVLLTSVAATDLEQQVSRSDGHIRSKISTMDTCSHEPVAPSCPC